MTSFFIKHPVIALVLNAMILIVGIISYNSLNIREYPPTQSPQFTIQTTYANASPEAIESRVTNVIEDSLAGLNGLETITSRSSHGISTVNLIFTEGTSIDAVLIAINEALIRSALPKECEKPIVERKAQQEGLPFIAISLSGARNPGALCHYAEVYLKNALRSIKGVSTVKIWGQPLTMAITLNPTKLYAYGINPYDIYQILQDRNFSWPVGKFQDQIPTNLEQNLKYQTDFEDLYIKDFNQKPLYLSSVAKVKLKYDDTSFRTRVNGESGLLMAIDYATDANPLEVSSEVKERVQKLAYDLPKDLKLEMVLDQAEFIRTSLSNIKTAILEAIFLVIVIVLLFFRNIRATIIPLITIPISIIGGVIFLKLFACSINTLTLLAMVLAIGLVVDDAIIILENIMRYIEKDENPFNAALKGSKEIAFAVLAMTLTLTSVYIPIAFIQGAVGQLFREFAVALAGSVLISGIVALTLSPLMCAKLLKHKHSDHGGFLEKPYAKALDYTLSHGKTIFAVFALLIAALFYLFINLAQELSPKEDRNLMGGYIAPIAGKGIQTMDDYASIVEKRLKTIPEASGILTFIGHWGANVCVNLKPITKRDKSSAEVTNALRSEMQALPSTDVHMWSVETGLPGIDGMQSGSLEIAISTTDSYRELYNQLENLRKKLTEQGMFQDVRHDLALDTPSYNIELDQNAIAKMGLSSSQIATIIEVFFSGKRNLTFQLDTVNYPITLEGKKHPSTLDELYLTTAKGNRVSLGAFAQLIPTATPQNLEHRDQMRTATLSMTIPQGQSLKGAMDNLWKTTSQSTSHTYKKEWTGIASLYEKSSMTMIFLLTMALVFIYAILAVQFESFLDPFIIMLTVPLGCVGALLTCWLFNQTLNIYTQVGLVTLIGLISKHGILMVEFANQLSSQGQSLNNAIRDAARLRLRPILMTTLAMVFGSLPLIISSGAGKEARIAIGAVLVGGLTFGTLFTLLVIPKFYIFLKNLRSIIMATAKIK